MTWCNQRGRRRSRISAQQGNRSVGLCRRQTPPPLALLPMHLVDACKVINTAPEAVWRCRAAQPPAVRRWQHHALLNDLPPPALAWTEACQATRPGGHSISSFFTVTTTPNLRRGQRSGLRMSACRLLIPPTILKSKARSSRCGVSSSANPSRESSPTSERLAAGPVVWADCSSPRASAFSAGAGPNSERLTLQTCRARDRQVSGRPLAIIAASTMSRNAIRAQLLSEECTLAGSRRRGAQGESCGGRHRVRPAAAARSTPSAPVALRRAAPPCRLASTATWCWRSE